MSTYICGITIGPIYDTILSANSPVSLWYSSILFSKIALDLIRTLKNKFGDDVDIISPYYNEEEDLSDGIGKYPDRIIFTVKNKTVGELGETLKTIFNVEKEVISELIYSDLSNEEFIKDTVLSDSDGNKLGNDELLKYVKAYFTNYLQFHYYFIEEEKDSFGKQLLEVQKVLDYLELTKTFNATIGIGEEKKLNKRIKKDPLIALYSGIDYNPNKTIKKSTLFQSYIDKNTFKDSKQSRNLLKIEEFAKLAQNEEKDNKIGKYFAMVNADGDNFGAFIRQIKSKKTMKAFSKAVYDFTVETKELIKDYGAAIYYMGGDDILMLAPLRNEKYENKNIFSLCREINILFEKYLSDKNGELITVVQAESSTEMLSALKNISISFGVSIKYYKFPLYETLAIANDLLAISKSASKVNTSAVKNATTVHVMKNSSKSVGLYLRNDKLTELSELVEKTIEQKDDLARTIIYKLRDYASLFAYGNTNKKDVLFDNIFDFYRKDLTSNYDNVIKKCYDDIVVSTNDYIVKDIEKYFYNKKNDEIGDDLLTLITMLKIGTFFIEEEVY